MPVNVLLNTSLSQDVGVISNPSLSPPNFETTPADVLRIMPQVRLSLTKIWFSSPPNQHWAKHNFHRQSDFFPRCKRSYLQSWNNLFTMAEASGLNAERIIKHQEPAKSSFIFISFISSNCRTVQYWTLQSTTSCSAQISHPKTATAGIMEFFTSLRMTLSLVLQKKRLINLWTFCHSNWKHTGVTPSWESSFPWVREER